MPRQSAWNGIREEGLHPHLDRARRKGRGAILASGSGRVNAVDIGVRPPVACRACSTREPRTTCGDELADEIPSVQPGALVWNTDELGKPGMLRLVYAAYREHDAEAVICVANSKVTWQVVHGMERCGIPAFGPIWDS